MFIDIDINIFNFLFIYLLSLLISSGHDLIIYPAYDKIRKSIPGLSKIIDIFLLF